MSARAPGVPASRGALAAVAAAVAVALTVAGCSSVELAPPQLVTRAGPAAKRTIRRVVALPATCGTLGLERIETGDPDHPIWQPRESCPRDALTVVDGVVRSRLELAGFEIIDSERVNAVTASRHEETTDDERTVTERVGARFADATPFEQGEILRALGADGVLGIRIALGAGVGMSARRTVAVQIRLLAVDGAMAWARRCELEVAGLMATDEAAMEQGARCAVQGVAAR